MRRSLAELATVLSWLAVGGGALGEAERFAPDLDHGRAEGAWHYGFSATPSLAPERFTPYGHPEPRAPVVFRHPPGDAYPYVAFNPTARTVTDPTDSWALRPGELALEASNDGRYSLVRFVAPRAGRYRVTADFAGIHFRASSTDVHVLVGAKPVFDAVIDGYGGDAAFHAVAGSHPTARYADTVRLAAGDVLTFAVGFGSNRTHFNDTTGLRVQVVDDGNGDEGPARR